MKVKRKESKEGDNQSIQVEILQHQTNSSDLASNLGSMFEPQRELNDQTPIGRLNKYLSVTTAPEKKLTLFALRVAILEKGASSLGVLGFVWATVVLLGGFAVTLKPKDFWFVTVILLIEGTRTFSRSHELEWQHQATTWSFTSASQYSFKALASTSHFVIHAIKSLFKSSSPQQSNRSSNNRKMVGAGYHSKVQYRTQRTWHSPDVPLLPLGGWVFLLKNVSRVFYCLQILSAIACGVLSLMRLIQQDYGPNNSDSSNRKPALIWFYALALWEALLFLTERTYWTWKIKYCKLLDQVSRECDLGPFGIIPIKRFFYDSYSKCIDGSIFDGLKMDLVSYGEELLDSNSREEQLMGAHILEKFTTNKNFSLYTLRKIGGSTPVIERLIEMLNWKNSDEEEIRRYAAEIVSKLAGKNHSAIRVAGIPGAMESISSLLHIGQKKLLISDQSDYNFSVFNLLGLRILKRLAHDHGNCWKIGNTRGLMPKIVDFTNARAILDSEIKIVKRSLQLVKILVCTTGQTGKMLRKEISEIVFTVSNARNILQYGESPVMLQKPVIQVLAIQVLAGLAMDEEARGMIGSNGGVIKILLLIFFKLRVRDEEDSVSAEAGEALAMLTLESKRNCDLILKEREAIGRLISCLNENMIQVNSSRILRNLCAYSGPEHFVQLKEVTAAVPTVMKAIMTKKDKPLEVSIGLAAQILRFTDCAEYEEKLTMTGIRDVDFATRLVDILKRYNYPEIKVPRIRRFVIELMIWMMRSQGKYIQLFKSLGAVEVLKCVEDTTSELESFNVFSGSVGLSRNKTTVTSLVDTALEIMD